MATDNAFTEEQIAGLTNALRGRSGRSRSRAVADLAGVDFERFERQPQVALLLAAMNAPALRDRARDSLARVLSGLDDSEIARLHPEERLALRHSLALAKPYLHADFLLAAVHTLFQLGDVDALPDLERLIERATITKTTTRKITLGYGIESQISYSFQGTPEEVHAMNRVRTAAHVACERLRLLAEQMAPAAKLLRPAVAPAPEQLVRPASATCSDSEHLVRPEP